MKLTTKSWIGIAILIILSPIGLIIPAYLKAGSAWGEWGLEEMQKLTGYIPKGLAKLSSLWNAPFADYAFKGSEGKGLPTLSFAYIISAGLGVIVTVILVIFIGRRLTKK